MKSMYIIADFDHTITSKDSNSSWDVLEFCELLDEKSKQKSQSYKKYYINKEKDTTISKKEKAKYMKEWLEKNLKIFIDNKLTKNQIDKVSSNKKIMELRKGSKELIEYTNKKNIPFIIISAGIKDVIRNYLKANGLMFDNVYILSNEIKYQNDTIIGFKHEALHTLNKNKVKYPKEIKEVTKNKETVILLGDNVEDIFMIPKEINKTKKIGFLNGHKNNLKIYKKHFDYVYEDEPISNVIEIIKNTHD